MIACLMTPRESSRRLAACALIIVLTVGASASAQTVGDLLKAPPSGDNPVVARVDKTEIKRSDVLAMLKDLPPQVHELPFEQVYPVLIERIVASKLLTDAGRAQKLQDDPEVKTRVAAYQDRAIQEAYINRQIKAKLTDAELKKRYDQAIKDNPPADEAHARHILVATEAEAKEIIARLDKGGDFKAIAKEKSVDSTGKDGGDLGFFKTEDMVPEFATAAFALKPGAYTKTPVKTQFGWHVIKLEEIRKAKAPSFDEAKDQITQDASRDIFGEAVKDLRDKSKVEILGFDGKPTK